MTKEETKETSEVKITKDKTLVVKELPVEQLKKVIGDDGITYTLLTSEEAQTEMLDILRQLKKGLL